MNSNSKQHKTIDSYIYSFPKDVQGILKKVKLTIKSVEPKLEEAIKYQMPTFTFMGKNLVHFAAWKNHIGFYPTPSVTRGFKKELAKYKVSKGAVQFPLEKPIPIALIKKIVRFRIKETLTKINN